MLPLVSPTGEGPPEGARRAVEPGAARVDVPGLEARGDPRGLPGHLGGTKPRNPRRFDTIIYHRRPEIL